MTGDLFSSILPPLPPTTEDDRFARLRLLRSPRIGPATYHRLIGEYGSAAAAFAALPEIAKSRGVARYQPYSAAAATAEITAGRRQGAKLVFIGEPDYPQHLASIGDAPPCLWVLGQHRLLHQPMVALVGARNASSLGIRMARRLAAGLSEAGYCVVSGLARGIDTAAHAAALPVAGGGGTLAVQAGGVDVIYPQENTDLARDIAARGLRLSEQPMGLRPHAKHFPRRNRIISGLSQAVVVIEAAAKSGSLITATQALDQGREVCAVPGHPIDARADGCNMLIRDGARLVRNTDDVLEILQHAAKPPQPTAKPPSATVVDIAHHSPERPRSLRETAQLHRQILDRLSPAPMAEDQLIRDLKSPSATVAQTVVELEMEGQILRHPGGLISRTTPH